MPIFNNIVGVCGVIGSGKSWLSKRIADIHGWNHVSSDLVFKSLLLNPGYRCHATAFMRSHNVEAFVAATWNASEIRHLFFNADQAEKGFPIIRDFNRMTRPHLEAALVGEIAYQGYAKPTVLEMATLPATPFAEWCPVIFHVNPGLATQDIVLARDGLNCSITRHLISHQEHELECRDRKHLVVDVTTRTASGFVPEETSLNKLRETLRALPELNSGLTN